MSSLSREIQAHLKTAKAYGSLSYAKRLKVGAVIVRDGRPIVVGRNGGVSGGSNVCEDKEGNTLPEVIHGELNCLLFAAREGIKVKGAIIVTTDSPCMACAAAIIQCKIKTVYYEQEYRDTKPLEFLNRAGIKTIKVEEDNE